MWNSQEDLSSQFEANPCITGPFLKRIRSGTASSNSIKMKNHNHETKKNVHQWLRLQEIFHRIKDCETNEEKYGLYLSKFAFLVIFDTIFILDFFFVMIFNLKYRCHLTNFFCLLFLIS